MKYICDVRFHTLTAMLVIALAGGCGRQSDNSLPTNADDRKNVQDQKEADARESENTAATRAAEANAAQAAHADAIATGKVWLMQTGKSEMDDATWTVLSRYSVNTISFDFPYKGEQRAKLQLELGKGHLGQMTLLIERGQFDCQDACLVEVRFDDQPAYAPWFRDTKDRVPSLYQVGWPTDYRKRFNADLLKSHRLRIQPRFYRQDAPVIEFYLDGLSEALATATGASAHGPAAPK